jgi:hypothetical protein
MFPVRYELNFYINLLINSVFKGLNTYFLPHRKQAMSASENEPVNAAYSENHMQ